MPRPAGGPRATVSGIGRQQRLRHQAPQPGQPGGKRQLRRFQVLAAGQAVSRRRGQPLYLGGDGGERLAEPPLCPSGGGAWPPCAGVAGRASQIASLTSTIRSVMAANSW